MGECKVRGELLRACRKAAEELGPLSMQLMEAAGTTEPGAFERIWDRLLEAKTRCNLARHAFELHRSTHGCL